MIDSSESSEWLKEFAQSRSESAFALLVERHLTLVYSVALRRCGGNRGIAEEVTQTVFIDLARQAGRLRSTESVAGWLFRHCCFVSAKTMRSETRRLQREDRALRDAGHPSEPNWSALASVLDDALLDLKPRDRDALLMRFYESLSYPDLGARFGTGDSGARMRVERALDALRDALAQRGITSTAAALATVLTGPAHATVPVELAGAIASAVVGATAISIPALGIGTLMSSSILKSVVCVALIAALGGGLLLEHHDATRLRTENAALKVAARSDQSVDKQESPGVAANPAQSKAELMRLRGEVARLRQQLVEHASSPDTTTATGTSPLKVGGSALPVSQWRNVGNSTPEQAAMTFMWAMLANDSAALAEIREPLSEDVRSWFRENRPGFKNDEDAYKRTVAAVTNGILSVRLRQCIPDPGNPGLVWFELGLERVPSTEGFERITPTFRLTDGHWRLRASTQEDMQPLLRETKADQLEDLAK